MHERRDGYTTGCMRGETGIPGWYQGGYGRVSPVHHGGYGGYTPPCTRPPCTTLGIPRHTTVLHTTGYTAAPRSACGEQKPWAQRRRNPLGEREERFKVVNPVKDRGRRMRRVTRSSSLRLDERSDRRRAFPLVSPMVRVCGAEGCACLPSDH